MDLCTTLVSREREREGGGEKNINDNSTQKKRFIR